MDITKNELREIICDVLKIKKTTVTIENQIHRFVMELGLSYKEVAQALVFFVEVEKGEVDVKFGIGIVPHVIDRARLHFQRLKRQKENQIESIDEANKIPDILLEVRKIRPRKKIAKININEIDVD